MEERHYHGPEKAYYLHGRARVHIIMPLAAQIENTQLIAKRIPYGNPVNGTSATFIPGLTLGQLY